MKFALYFKHKDSTGLDKDSTKIFILTNVWFIISDQFPMAMVDLLSPLNQKQPGLMLTIFYFFLISSKTFRYNLLRGIHNAVMQNNEMQLGEGRRRVVIVWHKHTGMWQRGEGVQKKLKFLWRHLWLTPKHNLKLYT